MAVNEIPNPSPRPFFVGRNALPQGQVRPMQQQQHQQYQLHQQMNYNHPSVHMPGNYAQSNIGLSPTYNNIGISPAPPARMNPSMQSPAAATTAPTFGQPTQQQQMYNHCPMNSPMHQQQQHNNTNGVQQQPGNMAHGYVQQNYNQQSSNNGTVVMGANMGYNNFNPTPQPCNNSVGMNPGGNYMVNQCGHVNPNNAGFSSGTCNHPSTTPTCNNMSGNNWQCYPNNMVPGQQMPFQSNAGWNNQMAGNQPTPISNQPQMMYNNMQTNSGTGSYNYPRPPPYPTAIQCQDVSQSQDFNRARAAHNQNPNTSSNPNANLSAHMNPNPNSNVIQNPSQNAPIANAGQTNAALAPGNMRPETYQRTLEYVQQCQTWTTGDSVKAAKENKPLQGADECVKPVETAVPSSRGSPGQDAVSSSTDRQDQTSVSAMIMSASNMVVHDMNTSLNSLMQENRFLQMIQ